MSDKEINIMFYDSSDWAGRGLRLSWILGGILYKLLGKIDMCKGFQSWEEALEWILEVSSSNKIATIEYWGHGTIGNVWLNQKTLSIASISTNTKQKQILEKIKANLRSSSTIWFRSCNVFAGKYGQLFAKSFSNFMNCRIAGHTFIVGPWQSGLHSIKAGEKPSWSLDEGYRQDGNGKIKLLWSKPWEPNTISCLQNKIPQNW